MVFKKKYIAFIFLNMPYGTSSAKEGLDILLSVSVLSNHVGVFFISDGVFLLVLNQNPVGILNKKFVSGFKILSMCGINEICLCSSSALDRGLTHQTHLILNDVIWLSSQNLHDRLLSYDIILKF